MAQRRNLQDNDASVPVVCRRPTTDLKDVQDILKSVVNSSEGFISRHTSINEEENEMEILEKPVYRQPLILGQLDQKAGGKESPPLKVKSPNSIEGNNIGDGQNKKPVYIPPLIVDQKNGGKDSPPLKVKSPGPVQETDGGGGGPMSRAANERRKPHGHHPAPLYGEIIVLGTNGELPCPPLSPKMSHRYILKRQPKATGVSLIVRKPEDMDSLSRVSTHTVSMTLAKSKMCVMEFGPDQSMDMFQIGRSADSAIDFVVVDTVGSEESHKKVFNGSSTVSRYACRILCEREPPYTARIYAAAFDTKGKIQISPMAPTWIDSVTGDSDGLTTNGIAILRPVGVFESGVEPGQWQEITVMGNIREMRPQRSSRTPGSALLADTNVLTDGCLIDLCGLTLMWRTALGLDHGPSNTLLRERHHALNQLTPQCPVNFLTLHFRGGKLVTDTTKPNEDDDSREPWVYMGCGHVVGQHNWKESQNDNESRTCPICSRTSLYVRLELGQEKAFFIDDGSLTHTFTPCGHVTTEQTAKYWSKVYLPHLASNWTSRCPFCSTPLDQDRPYVKLLFS